MPLEILSWFSAGHVPDSEPVQVQEYLLFPDCESVGVKLREQRFEIKAKSGPSRPLHLAFGIWWEKTKACSVLLITTLF